MADDSLALSPAVLFASNPKIVIPELVRSARDKFIVIPASKYAAELQTAVINSSVNPNFKYYLINLIKYVIGEVDSKTLKQIYDSNKKDVNVKDVQKYFGEVLGPLIILNTSDGKSVENVIFPERSNYELFDYFTQLPKEFVGYSAKIEGGSSNTLSPKEIYSRIANSKRKPSTKEEKIGVEVVTQFANAPMFEGIVKAAGILVKNGVYPKTFNSEMKSFFNKINFDNDSRIFDSNKTTGISKLRISEKEVYKAFVDYYILPKSRTISESEQQKYRSGIKDYTSTNIVYSLGKFIVEANTSDQFDLSPLVKLVFPDLNVVKISISREGIPSHSISSVSQSKDKYYLRSKHRWDVVKDKIGLQL